MNCAKCDVPLPIDQRIAVKGKIICGHCFVKEPAKVESVVEHIELPSVEQLMEAIVSLDDRLSAIEAILNK